MYTRYSLTLLLFLLLIFSRTTCLASETKSEAKSAIVVNQAQLITDTALHYVGKPYRFGGTSPSGFDCSGFIWYVFDQQGKKLPRTADEQFKQGKVIFPSELQRGDLVFFSTYEKGASHCGIYLERGKFIHASSHGVMVSHLEDNYWKARYVGAKRVL